MDGWVDKRMMEPYCNNAALFESRMNTMSTIHKEIAKKGFSLLVLEHAGYLESSEN